MSEIIRFRKPKSLPVAKTLPDGEIHVKEGLSFIFSLNQDALTSVKPSIAILPPDKLEALIEVVKTKVVDAYLANPKELNDFAIEVQETAINNGTDIETGFGGGHYQVHIVDKVTSQITETYYLQILAVGLVIFVTDIYNDKMESILDKIVQRHIANIKDNP